MENYPQKVVEFSKQVMEKAKDVFIISNFSNIIRQINDYFGNKQKNYSIPEEDALYRSVLLDFIASSINYCYFSGRHDLRSNGSSSVAMYNCLYKVAKEERCFTIVSTDGYEKNITFDFLNKKDFYGDRIYYGLKVFIDKFYRSLVKKRLPLLRERYINLEELKEKIGGAISTIRNVISDALSNRSVHESLSSSVEDFVGFGEDLFLKRAQLFFILLNQKYGWFKDTINDLTVIVDYHIPNALRYFGCVGYSDKLQQIIRNEELIPKLSSYELEIRAASILVCKELQKLTNYSPAEIDEFLFKNRKMCSDPFHLTITTDY